MREIKFRGKLKGFNTGYKELDWAYGDLVHEISSSACYICDLSTAYEDIKIGDVLLAVEPETVGQYTGLKDINGREIYEGDIVEFIRSGEKYISQIYYKELKGFHFKFKYNNDNYEYDFGIRNLKISHRNTKVIGNIYENPELLEK